MTHVYSAVVVPLQPYQAQSNECDLEDIRVGNGEEAADKSVADCYDGRDDDGQPRVYVQDHLQRAACNVME